MKLKSIASTLEQLYPLKSAEEWDSVGVLLGNGKQEITKVVVALDLTKEVYEKALNTGAELIITHHPFLFNEDNQEELEKQFIEFPYKKSLYQRLRNTGISVYAAHTNYDIAKEGMSPAFAKAIGLKFKGIPKVDYGFQAEIDMNLDEVKKLLQRKLGLKVGFTNVTNENKRISRIAFLPGTGIPTEILECKKQGIDLVVTSDVKWSTWTLAQEHEISIAQVPHHMEDVFVDSVSNHIETKFKLLEVIKMRNKIDLK